MATKIRKTLTLDPDVVAAFGESSTALSATVNLVLRQELDRRAERAALADLVADLDARFGEPDAAEVAAFVRDLG